MRVTLIVGGLLIGACARIEYRAPTASRVLPAAPPESVFDALVFDLRAQGFSIERAQRAEGIVRTDWKVWRKPYAVRVDALVQTVAGGAAVTARMEFAAFDKDRRGTELLGRTPGRWVLLPEGRTIKAKILGDSQQQLDDVLARVNQAVQPAPAPLVPSAVP